VFGGRDWTAACNVAGASPPENGTLRRGQSTKIRKKKSITNINLLKVRFCAHNIQKFKPNDLTKIVIANRILRIQIITMTAVPLV
jgi:hypothetical protein